MQNILMGYSDIWPLLYSFSQQVENNVYSYSYVLVFLIYITRPLARAQPFKWVKYYLKTAIALLRTYLDVYVATPCQESWMWAGSIVDNNFQYKYVDVTFLGCYSPEMFGQRSFAFVRLAHDEEYRQSTSFLTAYPNWHYFH